MKILLATPYLSANWFDAGLFFLAAASRLGHAVTLWDYRLEPESSKGQWDVAIWMKTGPAEAEQMPHPRFVYWSDDFDRTPGLLPQLLQAYDKVFTPVRPTPTGCMWLPTGWDPLIHRDLGLPRQHDSIFVGTYTPRKWEFLKVIEPDDIFGNNWAETPPTNLNLHGPVYLHHYVWVLNQARLLLNVHHGPVGLGRRFFEFIACGPTITDLVPGVEEVLGLDLAAVVGFKTPEEGKALKEYLLDRPGLLNGVWREEQRAIEPYTYEAALKRILECV